MTREQAEEWAERFNRGVAPGKDLRYEVEQVNGRWRVRARHPERASRPTFRERHPGFGRALATGVVTVLFWGGLIGGCGYLIATGGSGTEDSTSGSCEPSYPDDCLDPDAADYDCEGGSGDGPEYVSGPIRVEGSDPFRLDSDGDGIGCE
jgi:hypothetical protein